MKKVNIKDFINFWEKYYDEGKYPDKIYFDCLKKKYWRKGDLDEIFEWKNGSKLSQKKKRIVNKIYNNLEEINNFRNIKHPSEVEFNNFYKNICCEVISSGLVWRIFLTHLTYPEDYPMIDKFNFIAYSFLLNNILYNKKEVDEYLRKNGLKAYFPFRKFFLELNKKINNQRRVDRALMAFGQFLTNPQKFKK